MSEDVYPTVRGLAINLVRSPEFATIVHASPNFTETRVSQAPNPRWHYKLQYNYLKNSPTDLMAGYTYSDLELLSAFFIGHHGQADSFLFEDTFTPDHYIGPAMISTTPNTAARLALVHDTVADIWYSPIQRLWGGLWYEDILSLKGAIAVYANGALQTLNSNYTLRGPGLGFTAHSYAGMYLQWTAQPAAPITVQGYYYRRVRFEVDQLDFQRFLDSIWSAGGAPGGNVIQLETVPA